MSRKKKVKGRYSAAVMLIGLGLVVVTLYSSQPTIDRESSRGFYFYGSFWQNSAVTQVGETYDGGTFGKYRSFWRFDLNPLGLTPAEIDAKGVVITFNYGYHTLSVYGNGEGEFLFELITDMGTIPQSSVPSAPTAYWDATAYATQNLGLDIPQYTMDVTNWVKITLTRGDRYMVFRMRSTIEDLDVNGRMVWITGAGAVYLAVIYPAPGVPVLVSPTDGTTFTSPARPTFDWSDVPNATDYQFQISTNSGFTVIPINKTDLLTSNYTLSETEALDAGSYYWRVRAFQYGSNGNWTSSRSFTVTSPPPPPPAGYSITVGGFNRRTLGFVGVQFKLDDTVYQTPKALASLSGGYVVSILSSSENGDSFVGWDSDGNYNTVESTSSQISISSGDDGKTFTAMYGHSTTTIPPAAQLEPIITIQPGQPENQPSQFPYGGATPYIVILAAIAVIIAVAGAIILSRRR